MIGGLIVLALSVALVGPYFVDWTSYRSDFEREASAVLGRKVTVEGTASARLLPFPSVTFTDVVVGGANGRPAMTVETFSMDAELAPFLRGEVLIFDMRLVRPRARIQIEADGTVDWMARPSTPFDASQISLEKATVTDGEIEIAHAGSGRTHTITGIDTTISARTFAGPWRGEGSMMFDGQSAMVTASTGTPDGNGAMRLRVTVRPHDHPVAIETEGNVTLSGRTPTYAGTLHMNEIVLEQAGAGEAAPPGYRLAGQFTLSHERLKVEDFRFETGPPEDPYTAEGTAAIEFAGEPRFSVDMKGAQVRLEEGTSDRRASPGLTLANRLAALEQALLGLPRPTMPGMVTVDLPAVVAGDTTVRDVTVSAEPSAAGWTVNALSATLPGRTRLEAKGELSLEGQFGFKGSLLVAVSQPSGFAAWVAREVDDAIRRLPAAGFNAQVDMSRERQHFSDLELVLGNARFTGEIDRRQQGEARPVATLALTGGALDVDGLAAFASLFVSDTGDTRFSDHDIDLQLKAGPVTVGGLTAETVDTAMRLRQGELEIDRLAVGGLAGTSISATGNLSGLSDDPTGRLDVSIVSADLAPLIDLAAARYPSQRLLVELQRRSAAFPGLFENAELDLIASAADNGDGTAGVAISGNGTAGATAYSATFTATGPRKAPREAQLSVDIAASNPDATVLLALLGAPVSPLGMLPAGEATLSLKGTADALETRIALTADDLDAGFDGTVTLTADGAGARGKLRVDAADIEPWLLTTATSLPGAGLGTGVQLSADADYGSGLLVLNGLDGTVGEGAVSGDVNLAIRGGVPHLTGTLALDALDLEPLAGAVLGAASLVSADDGSLWPATPFAADQALPFTMEVDLTAGELAAGVLASVYDASLALRLDGEGLAINDLKGNLFGGTVSGLLSLKNTAGTGLLSAQLKLDGAQLPMLAPQSRITGTGNFGAEVTASGKSVGALVSALSGSGTASLAGLELPGLNADAFGEVIANADRIGRDIDAAKVAAFAPALASAGRFAAGAADVPFTIAGGVLRAPATRFEGRGATVTTDVRIDASSGEVAADGEITWQPGDEALAGSEPSVRFSLAGPIAEAALKFDSEPLSQFLTQRALEIEQARVEAMQTALLEKQRLRREARYYAALQNERDRLAEEARRAEEERLRAEEEARKKAEALARAEADAKARAEAEAAARAEEERRVEEERRRQEQEQEQELLDEADRAAEALRRAGERQAAEEPSLAPQIAPAEAEPVQDHPVPPAEVGATTRKRNVNPFGNIDDFFKSFQ